MLVCDKHRIGTPRIARYELVLKDLMAKKPEGTETRHKSGGGGQEYGKTIDDALPVKKVLCVECGQKLLAIIIAFIEQLKPEAFFDEIKEDVLEQTLQILARKSTSMENEKEVQVGGKNI